MNPTPSPASVAPSKRAAALPRNSSLPAVASAMKPRIEGTLAAVEAPSSSRVPARTGSSTVSPVMVQPVGQDAEDRRQDQLRQVEHGGEHADDGGVDRLPAVRGQVRQVQPE